MSWSQATLDAAHLHSADHRAAIERSRSCGCFHCRSQFAPAAIDEWVEDVDGTALCPRCGVDSVIGTASGFPVDDPDFLAAMHRRWFG